MKFNQFPHYQSLEKGSQGAPAQANRSIPDRIEDYKLLDYLKPSHDVLDLGCNRGYFGTLLSPHIKSYVGLEAATDQLIHSQRRENMTFLRQEYSERVGQFDVILCLAFHSYVDKSMEEFADDLNSMVRQEGYIFLEGHPKGYRGEPEQHLNPLLEALKEHFSVIEERKVKDRALKRPFYVLQKMSGMAAKCTRKNGKIYKKYHPDTVEKYNQRAIPSHWEKEIRHLKLFKGEKHVPDLIEVKEDTLVLSDCGDRVTKDNLPRTWKAQCKKIDAMQEKHGIYHFDVKPKNICVKGNTLYLIDWGVTCDKLTPIANVIKELIS